MTSKKNNEHIEPEKSPETQPVVQDDVVSESSEERKRQRQNKKPLEVDDQNTQASNNVSSRQMS